MVENKKVLEDLQNEKNSDKTPWESESLTLELKRIKHYKEVGTLCVNKRLYHANAYLYLHTLRLQPTKTSNVKYRQYPFRYPRLGVTGNNLKEDHFWWRSWRPRRVTPYDKNYFGND